jgi:hypothetical protein
MGNTRSNDKHDHFFINEFDESPKVDIDNTCDIGKVDMGDFDYGLDGPFLILQPPNNKNIILPIGWADVFIEYSDYNQIKPMEIFEDQVEKFKLLPLPKYPNYNQVGQELNEPIKPIKPSKPSKLSPKIPHKSEWVRVKGR